MVIQAGMCSVECIIEFDLIYKCVHNPIGWGRFRSLLRFRAPFM